MSVSRHPIALRLERQVGKGTRLLATVMALPLLDGIFAALVLAGAVSTVLGMIEVGLLIFGGSATVAVVLVEMDGTPIRRARNVLLVGALVVPIAALQAALAPTIASLLSLAIFERFAALVILAIAAKTASATVGEYLPRPAVIIALGFVASFQPNGFEFAFVADPTLVAYGTGAAVVGVLFALLIALLGPWLRDNVDIDRFRFGSAVALGVLPISILGLGPITGEEPIALVVLLMTAVLAFDPGDTVADGVLPGGSPEGHDGSAVASGAAESEPTGPEPAPATDGGDGDDDGDSRPQGSPGSSDGDRAPWV